MQKREGGRMCVKVEAGRDGVEGGGGGGKGKEEDGGGTALMRQTAVLHVQHLPQMNGQFGRVVNAVQTGQQVGPHCWPQNQLRDLLHNELAGSRSWPTK